MLDDWDETFFGLAQSILPKPFLDHYPIVLNGGGMRNILFIIPDPELVADGEAPYRKR